jgi:type II secretory pathway predicted ATPase ExeA
MYENYYGFSQKPFQITPDPDFLYLSPNHNHALQYLEYGIEHNIGIILLSGEVGAGKTTLIQYVRRQIGQNIGIVVLSNTNLVADQLLMYVLMELNIESDKTSKAHNLKIFKNYLQSLKDEFRRLILIIDESQNLPKDALEEIRMLSNFQADDGLPLQIFLFGQPEIRTILKSPGMRQIRQRIAVNYHLSGLSEEETAKYIQYRLQIAGATKNPFTIDAAKMIFKATSGIPRTINILCDSALLYGFAEELELIDAEVISVVLNELNLHSFVDSGSQNQALNAKLADDKNSDGDGNVGASMKGSGANVLKNSYGYIKQRFDKIDLKIDLLKSDIMKMINEALLVERRRAEDLMIENTTIKSVLKMLRPAEKPTENTANTNRKNPS